MKLKQLLNFGIVLFFFCTFSINTYSQTAVVRGIVTDKNNTPLVGVNVVEKGTTNGTTTDIDGNFSFRTKKGSRIIFSYIGFQKREIVWNGEDILDIKLLEDTELLDEVVIVGAYGSLHKRTDMVGSAYQVDSKKIESLPAGRIDNMLEGMVPGLQVMPNSDSSSNPKQRLNLRVRGVGSMSASNEPLWIVDGSRFYTGERTNQISGVETSISPLSYLNPDDIESITVLKDATSTSIYGADGANGVILITTKSGKLDQDKTKINVSLKTGISKINEDTRFKVLNAEEYLMLAKESYINSGRDLKYFPFQDNEMNSFRTTNTRWSDVYYDTGNSNEANMSLMGGSNSIKYYISTALYDNQSTIIGNNQNRVSLRANIDVKMSEKLNFLLNYTTSYNKNNIFSPGNDYYQFLPIYTPYNEDGTFRLYNKTVDGSDAFGNPSWRTSRFRNSVAEREENIDKQSSAVSNVNATLKYDIMDGLKFSSQFGVDYQNIAEERYQARTNWSGISYSSNLPTGFSKRGSSSIMSWSAVERFNYNKTFNKHHVSGILGAEIRSRESRTHSAHGSGFINDQIQEVSYAVETSAYSNRNSYRSLSFLLQGSYNYDKKYYVTINGRRDGNSGFGSDSQWGNFGSIGTSWNIHNEAFFDNSKVNILKVKASFGSNGNSRIGTQEALGLYSYSDKDNYSGELGGSMSGSPNKKLSWETAYMTNIGVRTRLFNRVDIDVEAYHKRTVNLLSNLDVSRTSGDTRSYRNSGEIVNMGIEANIEVALLQHENYAWDIELNAAHNKNKLVKLYNDIEKVMGNFIWRENKDLNTYYLIRWAGVDPRDGMPMWYDANGNLTRIYNAENRVAWKSSSPYMTGGFRTVFTYKDFSLTGLFSYVLGGYSFSSFGRNVMSDGLNIMSENQSINQLDRWQKPGDIATAPKPIWGTSTRSVMSSTRHLFKTTNVRFRNLSLNYNVPRKYFQNTIISQLRLSLIGDNLFVWSPYSKKGMNTYKQSMTGYPLETAVHFGVNLTFY